MDEDEAAIRAIAQRLQDGWNAGDGDAFAAPFAEDADYVIVDGAFIKGRAVIAAGHRQLLATVHKGSVNTVEVESVRFIRPDVALLRVHNTLRTTAPNLPPELRSRSSLVVTRDNGVWQIAGFQNTPIIPPREGFPDAAEVTKQAAG
jgi:uncharacterized protein (TIGR02246 family)